MSLPEDISAAERDFVELATRPLADKPEQREAAQIELLGQLSRVDPAERGSLVADAAARLAKGAPGRRRMMWLAAVWLLLAGIAGWQAFGIYRERQAVEVGPWKLPELVTEQRDFTDPADLEDYLIKEGKMPPDFHEIWTRIDPDNGAWPLLEAQWLVAKAYETKPFRYPSPNLSDEDFSRIWKLVEQAVQAPRFERYFPERRAARQAEAGAGQTVLSIDAQIHQIRRWEADSSGWSLGIDYPFAERALRLRQAQDAEGLKNTTRIWEALMLRLGSELATIEDAREVRSFGYPDLIKRTIEELLPQADARSLSKRGSEFSGQLHAPDCRDTSACGGDPAASLLNWEEFLTSRRHLIGVSRPGLLARDLQVWRQPPSTFDAGRLAEYALAERLLALASAVVLLVIMIPVWLKSIWQGRRVRALAEGLPPLLDKRDWLWLLGLGVAAPLAWYWGITRLTAAGQREFGGSGLLILVQAIATLLLALTMIEQAGRWRMARHMAMIGLSSRRSWLAWISAILLAVAVPLAAIYQSAIDLAFHDAPHQLLLLAGLLLPFGKGISMLFPLGRPPLFGALLSRTALPVMAAAVAVLLASHAVLLAKEKNLLARDPLTGWDAARGTTRYQAGWMELLNARCRTLWDERKSDPLGQ